MKLARGSSTLPYSCEQCYSRYCRIEGQSDLRKLIRFGLPAQASKIRWCISCDYTQARNKQAMNYTKFPIFSNRYGIFRSLLFIPRPYLQHGKQTELLVVSMQHISYLSLIYHVSALISSHDSAWPSERSSLGPCLFLSALRGSMPRWMNAWSTGVQLSNPNPDSSCDIPSRVRILQYSARMAHNVHIIPTTGLREGTDSPCRCVFLASSCPYPCPSPRFPFPVPQYRTTSSRLQTQNNTPVKLAISLPISRGERKSSFAPFPTRLVYLDARRYPDHL